MIRNYVAFLERHTRVVIAVTMLVVALSVYLIAYHLPIRADFSYLLPQDSPSVRDLRKLESRIPAKDTTLS